MADLRALAQALESIRFAGTDELALQSEISTTLGLRGIPFEREARFSAEDRVDFFVAGEIALEVKTQGATTAILRQLQRYAQHEQVKALLLVTNRARLGKVPETLSGKPVAVAVLRGWP